ncbi:sulfurtransferase TusA family protein [Paraburkholderia solisilvae]|uniref:sulfurtransferase TusA family protein n=1 Tax=Paraburkholderia solisilvae TaxID=624376 RepID=UPI001FE6B389|nr:sulfurtransferase TusA family protein [Paraburkholderia solisilvae]
MRFQVDARGLKCPLPILRAKKALAMMQSGECLLVFATDPVCRSEFTAYAKCSGNTIVQRKVKSGEGLVFLIRRK